MECWWDGRIEPNPNGIASYGVIIRIDGNEVLREGKYIGRGAGHTNNSAEYRGYIACLDFLYGQGLQNEKIIIYGDSQLVINQMSKKWNIKGGSYKNMALEALNKLKVFTNIDFKWIPKEENWECDKLALEAVKNIDK